MIFVGFLCTPSILSMSHRKCGDRTRLHIQGETDKELVEWELEFYSFVVEVDGNESLYSVCCLTTFSVCFSHLRSLVMGIPISRRSSVAISCWFAIV